MIRALILLSLIFLGNNAYSQRFISEGDTTCYGLKKVTLKDIEKSFNNIDSNALDIQSSIELIRIYNTLEFYHLTHKKIYKKINTKYIYNKIAFEEIIAFLEMERLYGAESISFCSKKYNICIGYYRVNTNWYYCLDYKRRSFH